MSYKIALVGCGRISKNHFEAIKEAKEFDLTGVCDIDKSRAEQAGNEQAVPFFTDLNEMISNVEMDIISICTPSGIHVKQGILAAENGIHVLTEKPMATRLDDADELIKACDKYKVHLLVVKQNRLNTTMQLLKHAIDKGRFGKIDMAKWRGTWEFDGGAFMNQASHYVDALEWLIGEPESVMGMTSTMARKIESEDMGAAIVKFRNGVIGTINVSMCKSWGSCC